MFSRGELRRAFLGHAYLDTVYDDEWVQDTIGVTPAELAELVSRQIGRYS